MIVLAVMKLAVLLCKRRGTPPTGATCLCMMNSPGHGRYWHIGSVTSTGSWAYQNEYGLVGAPAFWIRLPGEKP